MEFNDDYAVWQEIEWFIIMIIQVNQVFIELTTLLEPWQVLLLVFSRQMNLDLKGFFLKLTDKNSWVSGSCPIHRK